MPEMIDGVSSDIVIVVVAMAVVALQFFFCWKWNNLFVRLLPAISAVITIVTLFILMTQVIEGWEVLAYLLVYLPIAAIMLGAVIIGWIIWGIFCIAHNRGGRNPDGY